MSISHDCNDRHPHSAASLLFAGALGYVAGRASSPPPSTVLIPIAVPEPVAVPVLVEHKTTLGALIYTLEKLADAYWSLKEQNPKAASKDLLALLTETLRDDLIRLQLHSDMLLVATQVFGPAAEEAVRRSKQEPRP